MAGTSDANALILKFSADNSQLLKSLDQLNKRLDTLAPEWEAKGKKAAHALENSFTGEGIGKALDKVFDSSRLAVLEEGSAKIRIFGSALEPLGALGITAAAGIAGFAAVMERTEKAVEFAAAVAKVGAEVGVTTDFIQKFNFAAGRSDVDVGKADEALKALNASLGLVQSGLAKKQLVNAFAAIGFTPDQLRQFHDVGDLFPVLSDRIAKVGNAAEQAAIAKRLGIEELIPLLKEGEGGFNSLAKKAEDLGVVMDHSVIEKAKEAEDKLKALDDVMKAKSAVTFAEFADTLVAVKTAFLDAETAALRFLAAITGTTPAKERLKDLSAQITTMVANGAANEPAGRVALAARVSQVRSILATLPKSGEETAPANAAAKALVSDEAKHGTGPRDDSVQRSAEINAQLDTAEKDLLQAWAALVVGADQRADLQKEIIDVEQKVLNDHLDKQKADIEGDKGITSAKRDELVASLEIVRNEQAKVADLKKEQVDRQRDEAKRADTLKLEEAGLDAQAALLQVQESLADTAKQRRDIELRLLDLADQRQKAELEAVIASKTASDADKQIARQKLETLTATRPGREEQVRRQTAGPIEDFTRVNESADHFNQTVENTAVRGLDDLANGLAEAIVNAKSLGQVAKTVFRQMAADLLAAAIKKDIEAPLLAAIPGFASGTDYAPGGLALVGEHGPELVNLPQGASVTPNLQTMSALKNMTVPQGGGVTIIQPFHFHAEGAVLTEELLGQANAHANKAAAQAGQWARSAARQDSAKAAYSQQLNQ